MFKWNRLDLLFLSGVFLPLLWFIPVCRLSVVCVIETASKHSRRFVFFHALFPTPLVSIFSPLNRNGLTPLTFYIEQKKTLPWQTKRGSVHSACVSCLGSVWQLQMCSLAISRLQKFLGSKTGKKKLTCLLSFVGVIYQPACIMCGESVCVCVPFPLCALVQWTFTNSRETHPAAPQLPHLDLHPPWGLWAQGGVGKGLLPAAATQRGCCWPACHVQCLVFIPLKCACFISCWGSFSVKYLGIWPFRNR